MIRFFDMFSGIGGFRAGLERAGNTHGLRLKTTHEAAVAATGAEQEAAV